MRRTQCPRVISQEGGFAALFQMELPGLFRRGWEDPVLVSCTDGVGTKLKIAVAGLRAVTDEGDDLVAQLDAAVALLAEKRVAEDDVRLADRVAQPLDLVDDVLDRARPIARENPVRAVGAELGAAARGEHGQRAAVGATRERNAQSPPRRHKRFPVGERQRIEIVDLRTGRHAAQLVAVEEAEQRRFGLAIDDEIGGRFKQLRQLLRGESDEATTTSLAFLVVVCGNDRQESARKAGKSTGNQHTRILHDVHIHAERLSGIRRFTSTSQAKSERCAPQHPVRQWEQQQGNHRQV